MKPTSLSSFSNWRDLYASALFEDDKSKVAVRIAEAELAMLRRAQSVFSSPQANRREAVELDQSLRMLRLLKNCLIDDMERSSVA